MNMILFVNGHLDRTISDPEHPVYPVKRTVCPCASVVHFYSETIVTTAISGGTRKRKGITLVPTPLVT